MTDITRDPWDNGTRPADASSVAEFGLSRWVIDQFERLYAESGELQKIMAVAIYCYLSRIPHEINYVHRLFEEVLSRPGVAAREGTKILDSYNGQAT